MLSTKLETLSQLFMNSHNYHCPQSVLIYGMFIIYHWSTIHLLFDKVVKYMDVINYAKQTFANVSETGVRGWESPTAVTYWTTGGQHDLHDLHLASKLQIIVFITVLWNHSHLIQSFMWFILAWDKTDFLISFFWVTCFFKSFSPS